MAATATAAESTQRTAAFRVFWGLLARRPDCTEDDARAIFFAGMAAERDLMERKLVLATAIERSQDVRQDIADELEAAAQSETQYVRALLYRQIAARLRGGQHA